MNSIITLANLFENLNDNSESSLEFITVNLEQIIDLIKNNKKKISQIIEFCNKHKENSNCLCLLGLCYQLKKDYNNAIKYYELSISADNIFSISMLANLYLKCRPVKNYDYALKLYEKGASLYDYESIIGLCSMYERSSPEKAIEIYETFIDSKKFNSVNTSTLINNLALLYEDINFQKSLSLFEKGVELNNTCCMFNLAESYKKKFKKNEKLDEIVLLYNKMLSLNNFSCLFFLIQIYIKNKKFHKNIIEIYKMVVDIDVDFLSREVEGLDFEPGLIFYTMGNIYMDNKIVDKDYSKAIKMYEKAILLDHLPSVKLLAIFYSQGLYIEKNLDLAIELINKAKLLKKKLYRDDDENSLDVCGIYSSDNYEDKVSLDDYLEKINDCNNLKKEIDNLKLYITHLETLPHGIEYKKALDDFNNLKNND